MGLRPGPARRGRPADRLPPRPRRHVREHRRGLRGPGRRRLPPLRRPVGRAGRPDDGRLRRPSHRRGPRGGVPRPRGRPRPLRRRPDLPLLRRRPARRDLRVRAPQGRARVVRCAVRAAHVPPRHGADGRIRGADAPDPAGPRDRRVGGPRRRPRLRRPLPRRHRVPGCGRHGHPAGGGRLARRHPGRSRAALPCRRRRLPRPHHARPVGPRAARGPARGVAPTHPPRVRPGDGGPAGHLRAAPVPGCAHRDQRARPPVARHRPAPTRPPVRRRGGRRARRGPGGPGHELQRPRPLARPAGTPRAHALVAVAPPAPRRRDRVVGGRRRGGRPDRRRTRAVRPGLHRHDRPPARPDPGGPGDRARPDRRERHARGDVPRPDAADAPPPRPPRARRARGRRRVPRRRLHPPRRRRDRRERPDRGRSRRPPSRHVGAAPPASTAQ